MTEKLQGGAMGGVEELYREVILDHFKTPKNRGELADANAHADGMNPLCGDQLSIAARRGRRRRSRTFASKATAAPSRSRPPPC